MEDEAKVTLRVFRFNPSVDGAPRYQPYVLPWTDGLSVLEALKQIYYNVDGTLAFHNYYCGRGLCQGCMLKISSRTQRGCQYMLKRGEECTVDPPDGFAIIRDLRVDFGTPVRSPEGEVVWVRDGFRMDSSARAQDVALEPEQ